MKNISLKMGVANATLILISFLLLFSFNHNESFIKLTFLSLSVFTGLILSSFGLFYSFKEKNLVTITKFILSLVLNLLFPLIILFLLAMNLNDFLNFL
ncbi:hypothetical protein EV195_11228 [Tenacibaculum skagerrakense]|uniref:LIVCS family branched-chain amino acid:cation transporter n=1 Tax=Tenacibaculum skagerrakense TaxID=186571 RepID=A0A4R2NL91_9FLAO|nr:hypothetical protein EV195_11228 [Tenacibaculum skagerrakense]